MKLLILGTGSMARSHALAFKQERGIELVAAVETNACTFEHILSPEVTDRICTFLGHPKTCPHGSPIPPGECCQNAARGRVATNPGSEVRA